MWMTLCWPLPTTARRIVRHMIRHPLRAAGIAAPAIGSLAFLLAPTPVPPAPVDPACGCRQVWVADDVVQAAYEKMHDTKYLDSEITGYIGSGGTRNPAFSSRESSDSITDLKMATAPEYVATLPNLPDEVAYSISNRNFDREISVPEPSSLGLYGTGSMLLLTLYWTRHNAQAKGADGQR